MHEAVLHAENIAVTFHTERGDFKAIHDIHFSIAAGEIVCLVGESGCGKSMTAKALMRLTPENTSVSGKAFLQGQDMFALPEKKMRSLRGQHMGMIFQEPMTALNPVLRVGDQCIEHLQIHKKMSLKDAKKRCLELFQHVGIPAPENRFSDYPHQLSGGMRQRVVIAMALACSPKLLLADEPTTALDVTIQWQILNLLQNLAEAEQRAILLITHDLGVVAQMAHRVAVMYAGEIVEYASVKDIFNSARHPYTQSLLQAFPGKKSMQAARLPTIRGSVPPIHAFPTGCRFHPRCPKTQVECTVKTPPLTAMHPTQKVRCYCA